jgi:hypothetical protein
MINGASLLKTDYLSKKNLRNGARPGKNVKEGSPSKSPLRTLRLCVKIL